MFCQPSTDRFAFARCVGVVLCLTPGLASAQTNATWDGGGTDNLWSTGANWVGDVAPTPSTSLFLTFPGSTRTSPFNDRADFSNVAGITFASGASGFRIEGNAIGLVNGSGQQVINQNATATQDINTVFSLGSLQDSQINLNAGDLLISAANTYIDSNNSVTRLLTIAGTDSTRRTITYAGNLNKSSSGNDPDMIIQNNKRVLVTGSLTFGSGNDASVFINDGVLQFSGAGTMTGGSPAIGNTSGSANAALLLDTAGATFARQIEMRGGSSGQRILGGVNASGTVTYSGNFVANNSPANYDLKATSGGAVNFSGSRDVDAGLLVNRADADGTYGGAVILSGPTSSNSWNALYAGTLQFSDYNQLGSSYLEFDATTGDSGTLRYTGGSTTTTKTLYIDNPGITRAGIDVSQAGTTLTWNPGTSNLTQNLTKTGAGSLSFGGAITGGSVSVESGLLSLTAGNSYAGGSLVSQGTLMGGASTSFGSGSIVLGDGNTGTSSIALVANSSGNTTIANAITVANLGTGLVSIGGTNTGNTSFNAWNGTLTLNRNVQVFGDTTPGSSGRTSLFGQITGSGGITVTQGRVTLQNTTNNFTGPVVVNSSATLQLDVGGGTNEVIPNSSAVTVNGSLNFASGGGTETIGSLAGSGTVSSVVGGNYSFVIGGSDSTTFSGVINNGSGTVSLTKSGTGALTLSGTSTYSGATTISNGTLQVAGLLGGGNYGAAISNNASLAFSNSASQTLSGVISGSGTLTKAGLGTLTLSQANSYSGGTTITGGTVQISAGGSAGGSTAGLGTGTVSIGSGAQLTYYLSTTGSHTISNAFSLSGGTLYSEDGNNTFSGRVTLASGASTISSRYQDTITLAGGLTGSGNVLLTQAGGLGDGPTYVLSGTGANTGTVRVSGSSNGRITKLQVANVNALQSATLDLATGDVGTVEFTVPGTNTYALGGLQGARNLAFGGNSLSVGGNGQSTTYSGVLTGSASLTKVGGGRLTLAGANTFSGTTNVQAGDLAVDGSIVGSLSVASLASLSGTGTVGGNATIAGTHSPGNSPGAQTFNGYLTYEAGAVVNWELIANTTGTPGTNYDQIIVPTGNLTFSGSTTLALSFDSLASSVDWADPFWNVNRSWTVYDLSGGTTNSLSNLSLGGSLLDSLNQPLSPTGRGYFTTSLSGQDVMLNFVAVPEPLTLPLVGIAAAFLVVRRRAAR